MKRRDVLKASISISLLWGALPARVHASPLKLQKSKYQWSRVRPHSPQWPTAAQWKQLDLHTEGRLIKIASPFASCNKHMANITCEDTLKQLKNPYFVGDQPALTQTSGWVHAWRSQPSAYAVAAKTTADVVAAVRFARRHNLRLVIKGGGHSYLGTSNAPDSLLIWTRAMNAVTLHEDFIAQGSLSTVSQPAVTVEAGAMWSDAYSAVTTRGGRYVQGGGCTTVGVAGLVQSGGFGNFSKNYGTAAANLLEAEVVTADGMIRIANEHLHPDLFWAIKGGGGGSFGVVTRLTLRTFPLPEYFGAVFGAIKAASDTAYQLLIARILQFYQESLFNPHWGETVSFHGNNTLQLSMVFQGLNRSQVEMIWSPFLDWVKNHNDYTIGESIQILEIPAQRFWDAGYFREHFPGVLVNDERKGASPDHVVWDGDRDQVGWFIHGYQSAWLPAASLGIEARAELASALFSATRNWSVALHFNKGLAGAPEGALSATRNTAMNPQVLNAFALAIIAGGGGPAYPGMPGGDVNESSATSDAQAIGKAMAAIRAVVPNAGAYVSESDYFLKSWQIAYWGENYSRLAAVKQKYDPDGLFIVHHGVGSEQWSEDGFARRQA